MFCNFFARRRRHTRVRRVSWVGRCEKEKAGVGRRKKKKDETDNKVVRSGPVPYKQPTLPTTP